MLSVSGSWRFGILIFPKVKTWVLKGANIRSRSVVAAGNRRSAGRSDDGIVGHS